MKKVDLIKYKDKIKKLHKAAIAMEVAHYEYESFQKNKLLNSDFDIDTDWKVLTNYMKANPDLSDKLDDVTAILKKIAS